MGEMVSFAANGHQCDGYLATPAGSGPGIVVIQEWWGIVDHIKDVCERFASEGFVAIAPDLFHGEATKEPDEANKLMMSLEIEEAAKDMGGAFQYLQDLEAVDPKRVGCVGFCMGGGLSLFLATARPVDAAVAYYGIPYPEPDYSKIRGAVLGHYAEHDGWAPDDVKALFQRLRDMGKDAEVFVYPGTEHAFFNDTRSDVYNRDAAEKSWERTLGFFRERLSA